LVQAKTNNGQKEEEKWFSSTKTEHVSGAAKSDEKVATK